MSMNIRRFFSRMPKARCWIRVPFAASLVSLGLVATAKPAHAAPQAHILRIDPRAGVANGKPVLTTVIEVVQFSPISQVLAQCASESGVERTLTCWSNQVEKPNQLWQSIPFPESNARFVVKVKGEDHLVRFESKTEWGKSDAQPGVGTAWLIAVDASSSMGARYGDAREVAHDFIEKMKPNDLMNVMIFDDRQVIQDSKWITFKDRNNLVETLKRQPGTAPSHGSSRALFDQVKKMTIDAFGSLGNVGGTDQIPLHQAMVLLSNGAGRNDATSNAASAEVFKKYMNTGRFPEENKSIPKTPVPVISVWFPNRSSGLVSDLLRNNDAQFMQALANPEIGGFFDVIQEGQGKSKGGVVVDRVRERFNKMWIVQWRLACLNPSVEQSFNLVFTDTKPVILGDGSFTDVPLGVDPTEWPLDVDVARTTKEAQENPIYPGGTFRVYGDFCWGGDKSRGEAYFVPAGTKPSPQTKSRDPELAKKAMQQLIAQNMRGGAIEVGDTFATFQVPDDEKVLEGTGDNTVARVVLYDNSAKRASAVDEKTVLSLKASKKPLNILLLVGIAGALVVLLLLVLVLVRSGGNKKRGGTPPPYAPPPPGPGGPHGGGYPGGGQGGAPPYGGGYGGPPPQQGGYGGGGYQMADFAPAYAGAPAMAAMGGGAPAPAAMFAPAAQPIAQPVQPPAHHAPAAGAGAGAGAAVIQVRCPSCNMMTMATLGQSSVCFSCGQPLPADVVKGGGAGEAPTFPLTGKMGAVPMQPPANPYDVRAASIVGSAGQFSVRPGNDVCVGRDPAKCPILLSEARISAVHATLKLENAQFWVRDENSNNGTYVNGQRLAAGTWTSVPPGGQLRFGPLEFTVQFET